MPCPHAACTIMNTGQEWTASPLEVPARRFKAGACRHMVTQGETLSGIAARYKLTWHEVFALNSILVDPSKLQPQTVISIGRSSHLALDARPSLHLNHMMLLHIITLCPSFRKLSLALSSLSAVCVMSHSLGCGLCSCPLDLCLCHVTRVFVSCHTSVCVMSHETQG